MRRRVFWFVMTNVTQILSRIEQGDVSATEQLLPLVYHELRKLAAAKLAHEKPGHTLQATALVHEVYLRLVDVERVKLRYFLGYTVAESAEILGIAAATAEGDWTYAKAWLRRELRQEEEKTHETEKKAPGFGPRLSH